MARRTARSVGVVVLSFAAACASGDRVVDAPTTPSSATTSAPATSPATSTTTVPATVPATIPPPTGAEPTTEPPTTTTTLPGGVIDPMFTPAGAELGAVGVPFDAPLVLRSLPGDDQLVVTALPPLATDIVSTGRARTLGVRSAWLEVTVGGEVGWLPLLNLLYVGRTEDTTERFVELIGRVPQAPSMLELGRLIAESIAPTDFDVPARIVAVTEPFDGATGEVTFDVLDLPDDSVGGQRLRVTGRALLDAETIGSGVAGYELVTVEATALCRRGAGADGLCP